MEPHPIRGVTAKVKSSDLPAAVEVSCMITGSEDGADELADSRNWPARLSDFHETLFKALGEVQPLVVLFSLATVVASFLKQSFPNASIWSLVAALGFGWALIFSMLVRFTRSEGVLGGFAMIYHLIVDVGVALGFASIGATLFVLSQASGLPSAAYQFLFCEVFSLAIAPWAVRIWETSHSLRPGEGRRGIATLGWGTLVVMSLALGS